MKKITIISFITAFLTSCTAEPITQPPKQTAQSQQSNTFTVIWDSNQEDSYVELNTYNLTNCQLIKTSTETHREKSFEVTLNSNQKFDIQILRLGAKQKYPELYLAIYKGAELQYEQEVNTNGFLLTSYVDGNGNISKP